MSRLHCDVADEIAEQLARRAEAARMPVSQYLATLVQRDLANAWPDDYFMLRRLARQPLARAEKGHSKIAKGSPDVPARHQRLHQDKPGRQPSSAILGARAKDISLCSVVKAELLYGARHSQRIDDNLRLLEAFFAPLASLPLPTPVPRRRPAFAPTSRPRARPSSERPADRCDRARQRRGLGDPQQRRIQPCRRARWVDWEVESSAGAE